MITDNTCKECGKEKCGRWTSYEWHRKEHSTHCHGSCQPSTLNGWEKRFWKMTDEKGVGSNVRYAQACRDFIHQEKAVSREEGYSKAIEETMEAVRKHGKAEYIRRWEHTKVGEEIEKRNGYTESLDDALFALDKLKKKV